MTVRVVRDADRDLTRAARRRPARRRASRGRRAGRPQSRPTTSSPHVLSTLRLVKDEWEIEQMRLAVEATHDGFEAVIADLPRGRRQGPRRALGRGRLRPARPPRGQRRRLRLDLRRRRPRQHAALDQEHRRRRATATSCCSTPASRSTPSSPPTSPAPCRSTARSPRPSARSTTRCYAAQEAGLAAVSPGNKFCDVHDAAIRVIAEHLHAWGLLPEGVDVEDDPRQGARPVPPPLDGPRHEPPPRASTSTTARRPPARSTWTAELQPGMVLTVEPGLYFKADDLLAPERVPRHRRADRGRRAGHRGRLREPLGRACPAPPTDVEAWIAGLWNRVVPPEG